jgi:hypothetical protein
MANNAVLQLLTGIVMVFVRNKIMIIFGIVTLLLHYQVVLIMNVVIVLPQIAVTMEVALLQHHAILIQQAGLVLLVFVVVHLHLLVVVIMVAIVIMLTLQTHVAQKLEFALALLGVVGIATVLLTVHGLLVIKDVMMIQVVFYALLIKQILIIITANKDVVHLQAAMKVIVILVVLELLAIAMLHVRLVMHLTQTQMPVIA